MDIPPQHDSIHDERLARIALIVVGAVLAIKLLFIGLVDLLPEEAYYWNYAAHLDTGYLDHPPMVAWLGWLSEAVLGHSEFAVRFPAFLCWIVMAVYLVRLTNDLVGRRSAAFVLLLIALLPIYWSVGFLMTPDAPLYASWAMALFYLRKALVDGSQRAWLLVGLAIGLGLLSKYTVGLVGLAAMAFILIDRRARGALLTPGPYLATALAILIFSPVLYWNATNHWASFAFQGTRRWALFSHFNLHVLIGSALILLTPVGLFDAARSIRSGVQRVFVGLRRRGELDRNWLFALIFCLLPLSVFIIHSLSNQTKLNWTGPVWLVILPYVAARIARSVPAAQQQRRFALRWTTTFAILFLLYPVGLAWLTAGGPGMPRAHWSALPVAWEEFSEEVNKIEEHVEEDHGREPLITGTDKYWIASQLSFYHEDEDVCDSLPEFAGSGMISNNDLMWSRWYPSSSARGREVILIGLRKSDLDDGRVSPFFADLTPVVRQPIRKSDREVGDFYWRLGTDYTPLP